MAIANATSRSLDRAILRAIRPRNTAVDRLVTRLTSIFPADKVERDAEIRGASTHAWRVDAVVHTDSKQAVFEIVTEHPNSVAFAATKFHDFARMDDPPVRIAVVHRKEKLGAFLAVVSQAAMVIEDDAADGTYLRAAQAA
jgi:hypothetical protein